MNSRLSSGVRRLLGSDGGETRPYECRTCESRFDVQYHVCPNCRSYLV